jgi:hypothetical protein
MLRKLFGTFALLLLLLSGCKDTPSVSLLDVESRLIVDALNE